MSCQIKHIASVNDVSDIRKVLFEESSEKFDVQQDELPLPELFISLSPTGDVLAMAYSRKMCILLSRWDSSEPDEVKNKLHMTRYMEVAETPNELITSLICLPLLSLGKASSVINPDWTCIIVGFNTGYIRFYTETGALLLSQQLHNEPVIGLKCQSFHSPRYIGDVSLNEEVYVVYDTVVCVLSGFSLFSTLRTCRNHLARVQANCDDVTPPMTKISYKKWGFKSYYTANDADVIGTTSVNSFDHLMTASICGGFHASYRSSAPQHTLVMTTGKQPFVGFHYAFEGGTASVLSDVTIAVASKLTTAIGTAIPWLPLNWGNSKQQVNEESKNNVQEPVDPMTCRFGLADATREGYAIVSSPNKMLSVVLDEMGRILLIDNKSGTAVRMLKGYRDVQCGWVEVEEERHSGMRKSFSTSKKTEQLRSTLFLVIYAPKKGVIDIWGMQQGPKIATFTASKHGRLLYINYGLVGGDKSSHSWKNKPQYSCIFVDPFGSLKEITVPFYFSLDGKNSKKARDIHLLRKLKTYLREDEFDCDRFTKEVESVCSNVQTTEIKVEVIEMLMTNKHIIPNVLLAATDSFIRKLDEHDQNEMDPTAKRFYLLMTQIQQVTEFYKHIKHQFDESSVIRENAETETDLLTRTNLASILLTSEREICKFLELVDTVNRTKSSNINGKRKVTFEENGKDFRDFLSCFEFGTPGFITVKKDIKPEKKQRISDLMYKGCVNFLDKIETWREAAVASNIQPFVFMEFALLYWLEKKEYMSMEIEMTQFTKLLQAICSRADITEICPEDNEISLWWKKVRNILADSTDPFNALSGALMCRAVALMIEKKKERTTDKQTDPNELQESTDIKNPTDLEDIMKSPDPTNDGRVEEDSYNLEATEWENVTKDGCQFALLIGNLEDITVLDAVVSQESLLDDMQFFAIPFSKVDISLSSILSKGKGSVSEIVAKWISSTGIDPVCLVDKEDDTEMMANDTEVTDKSQESIDSVQDANKENCDCDNSDLKNPVESNSNGSASILEKIKLLKSHFPYSLSSSVLLANLCWEFSMYWNRDITRLKSLDAALTVLKQIPMKQMRCGVYSLLWSVHVKKRMEAVAKIMNKLGKLPKERLCTQEIGLSDTDTIVFLQKCVNYLEIPLNVSLSLHTSNDASILVCEPSIQYENPEMDEIPEIKSEELWEGFTTGPTPFASLAVSQKSFYNDLILLHFQLANILYMMGYFNLKVTKPMSSLFDSTEQSYFFQSICSDELISWCKNDKRDSQRTEFLFRVITASMDTIHQETEMDGTVLDATEAVEWMNKCEKLARIWRIDRDELRIHQVCQLYINGFDKLAKDVFPAVNNLEKLATLLLPIAGRRMMGNMLKHPDHLVSITKCHPALTKYLGSLSETQVVYTNCSNEDTYELIARVYRYLPESHPDHHLAEAMLYSL